MKIQRVCENCKKTFWANDYDVKKGWGRFCSQYCKLEINRVWCKCKQCGKEFQLGKYRVADGQGKFCSKVCDAKWRSEHMPKKPFYLAYGKDHPNYKEKVKSNCAQCGKDMEVYPYRAQTKKYCSQDCYDKSKFKQVEKKCAYCGKSVMVKLRYKRKNPERNFCNMICKGMFFVGIKNPSWRGGYEPYYGEDWEHQRRAARKRDKYTCQHCGIKEAEYKQELDVHHIVPRRKFNGDYKSANKLSNLISLCMSCHRKAEPRGG